MNNIFILFLFSSMIFLNIEHSQIHLMVFIPKTRRELKLFAISRYIKNKQKAIDRYGEIDSWDVSNVTDMNKLFKDYDLFDEPIENWDVSNVTNMYRMFEECTAFNQNIENWDVSKVTDMGSMFKDATSFNQPIGNWNVSNVENICFMFTGAKII